MEQYNGKETGGIVGYFDGTTFSNGINNGNVIGTSNTGGVIGSVSSSSNASRILECKNNGTVIGTTVGGLIGKLVGANKLITVEKCYSTNEVTVTNGGIAGGLIGSVNRLATVKDTYSTSTIKGDTATVGALIGVINYENYGTQTIQNSYAIGKINAEGTTGGLIGKINSLKLTVTNSYYSPKLTGCEESAGGTAKGVQELLYQDAYEAWDFENTWAIEPDGGSLAYLRCFGLPEEVTRDEVDYETRVGLTRKGTDGLKLTDGRYQVKNSAGEVVREGGTNSKGIFWIKDLEVGTYTVEEIVTPSGYVEDKNVYSFKMTEEGIAVDVETNEEVTLQIETEPLVIELQSIDNETRLGLQGLTIQLYDQQGNEIMGSDGKAIKAVTDSEGKVRFSKINPGTYKYKQTTTKTGYKTNEQEYTLILLPDGTITYVEENEGKIENEK